MSDKRKAMLVKMIKIHGFEHEATLEFARLLEDMDDTPDNDKVLETILDAHRFQSMCCYFHEMGIFMND